VVAKMRTYWIAAIDPGGTSGWALGELGADGGIRSVSYGEAEDPYELADFLLNNRLHVCVVEDFVAYAGRSHTGQKAETGFSPILVQGILRGWERKAHLDLQWELQSAANAKGIITDERLKSMGYWIKGQPHARDALRHLALFGRRMANHEVQVRDREEE